MGQKAWGTLAGVCLGVIAGVAQAAEPVHSPPAQAAPSAPPSDVAPDAASSGTAPPSTAPPDTAASAGAAASPATAGSSSPAAAPSTAPSPRAGASTNVGPSAASTDSTATQVDPPVEPTPETAGDPGAGAPSTASQPSPASLGWGSASRGRDALHEAERAVLEVDYERSLFLSQQAIAAGGLSRDELRRSYLAMALSASQLDRADVALPAFLRLFALDPNVEFTKRLAPARRKAALTAQQYWSSHQRRAELRISFNREQRQLVVHNSDPLRWVGSLRVWVRKPGTEFVEYALAPTKESKLTLDVEPLDVVDVYAAGFDEHGNVVLEYASAEVPWRFQPELEEELELQRDIRGGETGSVERRLWNPEVQTSVNGYVSLEFGPIADATGATFDLRHATIYASSQVSRHASVHLALDAEHVTDDRRVLTLPHAFVDIAVREWLVFRPGLFEAPVGAFNEYLWADFIRTTGAVPLLSTVVVPGLWSELGVQARGRLPLGQRAYFTYAAFVSNGLEQPDSTVGDDEIAEGGDLLAMRYNVRDEHNSDKAVGGRLGVQWGPFDVGASGYTGRYTIDANRRLTIADVDISYKSRVLTVRAEGAASFQEVTGGRRTKAGVYGLVSSRIAPHLEPYLQYDYLNDRTVVQHRVLFGNAMYPFPREPQARTLRLKTEVGVMSGARRDAAFVWLTQFVGGF